MNLTNINTGALRNLIKLTERKEGLLAEIEKIEGQLAALLTGKAVRTGGKRRGRPAKKGKAVRKAKSVKGGRSAKRAPRGTLKKKIFAALKAAGEGRHEGDRSLQEDRREECQRPRLVQQHRQETSRDQARREGPLQAAREEGLIP